MKNIFLALGLGVLSVSQFTLPPESKPPAPAAEQCKYTLEDAKAGLKGLAFVAFEVRKQSEDGNIQMGLLIFHDPKSADPESVDAVALVMRNKKIPDKELTFVVSYNQADQVVTFKRELKDGGKAVGSCFEKEIEAKKKTK